MARRVFLLVSVWLAVVRPVAAADYYLSAGGADGNAGTSPAAAWRTLARVNAVALRPGDRVLLRGGETFSGGLALDSGDAGTAAAPIVIGSYGTGRATIWAGTGTGIWAYNTAGIVIANLAIAGAGPASGINFYTDATGGAPLPFIRIDAVDVSGFGRDGIEIGAWHGAAGYADVRITNTDVHHNGRNGLFVYADRPNVHRQVYVGHVRAYENPGTSGSPANSGSGIVLGSVDGATIERSIARDNGMHSDPNGGPVGIWTYDSARVLIQYNESYRNRTGTSRDGGGFDLDQNVSDSVVQYNYSHDNDGAGFLLAQSLANDTHARNVVRFNVSQNDGRANGYAGIEIWGRVRSAEIYNNTVFVSTPAAGSSPAVKIWNIGIEDRYVSGVHLRNNLLLTTGGPVVRVDPAALAGAVDVRFEGNAYHAGQGTPVMLWGAATFTSLAAWRATGQETIAGMATGTSVDPQLTAAGAGPAIGDADRLVTLDAYRLRPGSPLADAGLDLRTRFGIDVGSADFYGAQPGIGAGFAIGAAEGSTTAAGIDEIVLHAASATVIAGAWRRVSDTSAAGGARMAHPDAGRAKLSAPLASPADYFELTFEADAGKPYRLWMRLSADGHSWSNDSVFAQFSGTTDGAGSPIFRIGSSSATTINLEDDTNAGVSGWGWQDNGWGINVLGPTLIFATSGLQTIRVQTREDGVSIDQIVLSARRYLASAPGSLKNDRTMLPVATAPGPEPGPLGEIVIHAGTLPAGALRGNWRITADASAASGVALVNPDQGAAKIVVPSASPASYVDVPFTVQAGVPYAVWIRMRATGNSYANDSIHVQLTGAVDAAGRPVARLGTSEGHAVVLQDYDAAPISGWGWNDNGWAGPGMRYVFPASGPQTLRIQPREDGIVIDQIVISPAAYLVAAPGAAINDTTIVRR